MVDPDTLAYLDHLQWLRTGSRAAQYLHCSQSQISRRANKCLSIFNLTLKRISSEWCLVGDDFLLGRERRVHQHYRWTTDRQLRFDCQNWLRDSCSSLPLDGWTKGNLNYLEYARPLSLLRGRIIDVWLCSAPDHPRDSDLTSFQLCSMPSYLVVRNCHPLIDLGPSVALDDVRRYPVLPLPMGAFPVFESVLESLGLHSNDHRLYSEFSLPVEDLLVGIASPLTIAQYGNDYVVLPCRLPVTVGDVLVVRSDFACHPRTQDLLGDLLNHLREVTSGLDDVEVHSEVMVLS